MVDVRLGTVNLDHYLRADRQVATDGVAVRAVGRGELVPASAVGCVRRPRPAARLGDPDPGTLQRRGARCARGPVVHTPRPEGRRRDRWTPRELAGSLTVAEVSTPSGTFGASGGSAVQVLVPSSLLPVILTALAAEGTVDVVPVLGTGG